ncbi:PLP-dependent aminotransferase family protein [Xanthobacter dioxanivorans]|uniref:PLP-dependent aminotransferase family protein n=1 Tax=Xanthobacter dioxanivorans TaxID=2528964 RepID=A0A974SJI3_9HYPH|nr:PLP-dependent aminotransferase family protein [Xanthobacter dioxanivorans]QRG06428.1 PLP-dependent aminotransferase family protein [Xanthobacter dioxanivorans]
MGTVEPQDVEEEAPSRIAAIVRALSERIDRGQLRAGEKLPSIRSAFAAFGVSRNTLVEAYERLAASGRIEARPGSGFYVLRTRAPVAAPAAPAVVEAVDSVWLLREQLEQHYDVRVGDGRPPPSWMEGSEVGRYLKPINRPGRRPFPASYGSPFGFPLLRETIAALLAERSIGADPSRVLMTQGANHALDLIVRTLVEPGDTVLVDAPGYYPLFGKLHLAKARTLGVRRTPEGPDPTDLAEKAGASGAKLFFTQSLAHNPTGSSLTPAMAYRVLQAAARHDLLVVESDPFADILPAGRPRLAALDQLERVVYVGTLAKTLSASLRCGYVVGSAGLIERLGALKMVTSVNSSGYVERIVNDLITSGQYRRHLKRLRGRVDAATASAQATLGRLRLPIFGPPGGGFYLWCALPAGMDDSALSRRAAERGILIAPGAVFHPGGGPHAPAMRINVAYADDPRFERFMAEQLAAG